MYNASLITCSLCGMSCTEQLNFCRLALHQSAKPTTRSPRGRATLLRTSTIPKSNDPIFILSLSHLSDLSDIINYDHSVVAIFSVSLPEVGFCLAARL